MTLDAAIAYVAEVSGDACLKWLEEAQQSSNDMETRVSGYHLQARDWLNALTDGNATKGDQQYRSLSSGLLNACESAATMLDNLASRRNLTSTHLHTLDRHLLQGEDAFAAGLSDALRAYLGSVDRIAWRLTVTYREADEALAALLAGK